MDVQRILIVDDEPGIRELLEDVAESIGFEVKTAANHLEFEELINTFSPSIVMLDLSLPDVDGIELLRRLSSCMNPPKVLLMSGFDSKVLDSAWRLGRKQGLDMIDPPLEKPIDIDLVEQKLTSLKEVSWTISLEAFNSAIEENQFIPHFQPKVLFANNTILASGPTDDTVWQLSGVEALARWQHPKGGLIGPFDFIPYAEENNLIFPLTETIFCQSMMQLKKWQAIQPNFRLAVNLSVNSLNDLDLPDKLAAIRDEIKITPDTVILEVTETAAMADVTATMDILTRFRLKGFDVSIDDFGTGYSSLVRLYEMPINELKIDQSFVRELGKNKGAEVVVSTMVRLAKGLGMKSCAEGVETNEAWQMLGMLGCDLAQGYMIAKPMEAAKITELLELAQGSNQRERKIG